MSDFVSSHISCLAFRSSIVFAIFIVWRYNAQDPVQSPIQWLLKPIVRCPSGYQWSFGLDIGFTDHLHTRVKNSSNCCATTDLHNSLITTAPTKTFPSCCVFTSCSLVTAPTKAIPLLPCSSPLWMTAPYQLSFNCPLSSQPHVQNWLGCANCLPYNSLVRPTKTTPFTLICVFTAVGMCLPSCSLASAVYSCLLRICCLATDVVPLSVSQPLPRNECCFKAVS
jgi:hypothetical protein